MGKKDKKLIEPGIRKAKRRNDPFIILGIVLMH